MIFCDPSSLPQVCTFLALMITNVCNVWRNIRNILNVGLFLRYHCITSVDQWTASHAIGNDARCLLRMRRNLFGTFSPGITVLARIHEIIRKYVANGDRQHVSHKSAEVVTSSWPTFYIFFCVERVIGGPDDWEKREIRGPYGRSGGLMTGRKSCKVRQELQKECNNCSKEVQL